MPLLVAFLLLLPVCAGAAQQSIQAMRSVKVLSVDDSDEPIRFPSSISYDRDGDEIYISSPQKGKLVVFTPDYFPYLSIGRGRGLTSLNKTFIKNGLLYVCLGASAEEPRSHIAVFDMAFMPVRKIYFPDEAEFSPYDLVVADNGTLYVVGMNGTGVLVLDPEGKLLRRIEPKDDVLGVVEKAPIIALDIDSAGRLYLLSEAMGRVFVYSPNEQFLYKFGEKGGEPGTLSRPRGVAVDDIRRQAYVVDYQRHAMSVYALSGEYLFEVGGKGVGRGWFYYPSDLIVDGRGRVVVADTFNHRVQVFEFVSEKGFGQQAAAPAALPEQPVELPKEVVRVGTIELTTPVAAERGDFLVLTAMGQAVKDAEALELQLRRKDYPVLVQTVERGRGGSWYQVLVGPYPDPLEAYAVVQKLREDENLPAVLKTRAQAFNLEVTLAEQHVGEEKDAKALAEEVSEELIPPAQEAEPVSEQLQAPTEERPKKIETFEGDEQNPFLPEERRLDLQLNKVDTAADASVAATATPRKSEQASPAADLLKAAPRMVEELLAD